MGSVAATDVPCQALSESARNRDTARSARAPRSGPTISAIDLRMGMTFSTRVTSRLWPIGFVFSILSASVPALAAERWTELNIGPFYVDSDGDTAAARDALTQLEQLRWVMGGLLESKDLRSVWPMRVILSKAAKSNPTTSGTEFVSQNGSYQLLTSPGAHLPLGQVASIFLESNTARMPPEVESGLQQLFDTLEAHGSRVTWGANPTHPDLAWARIQLLATKFEYGAHFHIFLNALRGGSTLRAAERNSFAVDPETLEKEVAAHLAKANWEAVSVGGRPLDPKRDFGEHSLDATVADVYVANTQLTANPKMAEAAYKSAIEAGGETAALGFEGLAQIAKLNREDPHADWESAIHAHSKSAPVYVGAALDRPAAEALPLLKKAAEMNPLWAEPVFRQAEFADDPKEKESLLKRATQLDPRISEYWIELAQIQTTNGHPSLAQGSWLKAEDSAKNEAERERIHQLRENSEQARLDALEAERRREREELHEADQRAQIKETDSIRAAEQKANRALDAAAGGGSVGEAVPFSSLVPKKKITGVLTQVDCLKTGARILVKPKAGPTTALFLRETEPLKLTCGAQRLARRVVVSYSAQADDVRHTIGDVTEFAWQ
jgi:hypothetical protein